MPKRMAETVYNSFVFNEERDEFNNSEGLIGRLQPRVVVFGRQRLVRRTSVPTAGSATLHRPHVGAAAGLPNRELAAIRRWTAPPQIHPALLEHRSDFTCEIHFQHGPCSGSTEACGPQITAASGRVKAFAHGPSPAADQSRLVIPANPEAEADALWRQRSRTTGSQAAPELRASSRKPASYRPARGSS
jgi:hypothetical protein